MIRINENRSNSIIIFVSIALFLCLAGVFIFYKIPDQAGDIGEYFGTTQSFINHGSFNLTKKDIQSATRFIHKEHFDNPIYYPTNPDGTKKYPAHFVGYSVVLAPLVFLLDKVLGSNPLRAFPLTNIIFAAVILFLTLKSDALSTMQKYILVVLYFASPLIFYFVWPGPDILFLSLLVLGFLALYERRYLVSLISFVLGSWHSQPLILFAFLPIFYLLKDELAHYMGEKNREANNRYKLPAKLIISLGVITFMGLLPYIYNLYAFGRLSPWVLFTDGWTELYGFGLQNISLSKTLSALIDPDIGVIWWFPLGVAGSIAGYLQMKRGERGKTLLILSVSLLVLLGYETNPAWHYGASGLGPIRHALYLIPFMIVISAYGINKLGKLGMVVFCILLCIQIYLLSFNRFIMPDFPKTFTHTPMAKFVIRHFHSIYNPPPEVFVDRTNGTDLDRPSSAIYLENKKCIKAYVLKTDKEMLLGKCGYIPDKYIAFFDDPIRNKKSSMARSIITNKATLWPDPSSCSNDNSANSGPFTCMIDNIDVLYMTGIRDVYRVAKVPGFEKSKGVWQIKEGNITKIHVPPGYITHYNSYEGIYIDY